MFLFPSLPSPAPMGYVWGWQPGGAAVQRPSLGTLQQRGEQQQLQWIRDQLRVWLRERKQLQREWRKQTFALLQPRGKGFSLHDLGWHSITTPTHTFSQPSQHKEAVRRCMEKKKWERKAQGSSSWHAVKWKWQIKAFETKMKKERTLLHFPQIGDEWSTLQGSQLPWSFMQLCLHSNGLLSV